MIKRLATIHDRPGFMHHARPALLTASSKVSTGLAAGERQRRDLLIGDKILDLTGLDEKCLKHSFGKPRAEENIFDSERALRHVRRVLEERSISGHQPRSGEPEDLPERKIPR